MADLLRNNFNARRCDDFVAKSFESIEFLITTFSCAIRWVMIYKIPPSKANKLTKALFINEFKPYLEHLPAQSGILLFTCDFYINWTDSTNCELIKFRRILSSYNLCQYVTEHTHDNGYCIDYIICKNDLNVLASDNISDHYALHASITCSRPHKECKQIVYRQINKTNHDSLYNDLTAIDFDFNETNIDNAVISYNTILLLLLLDKHAHEKCKSFAIPEEREWMTDEVHTVKRKKSQGLWRTSKLVVHR